MARTSLGGTGPSSQHPTPQAAGVATMRDFALSKPGIPRRGSGRRNEHFQRGSRAVSIFSGFFRDSFTTGGRRQGSNPTMSTAR
jgi:uncharacterized membrane protein YedE/YeeE